MMVRRSCSQRSPSSCVQAGEPTCEGEERDPVQGFRKDDNNDNNMHFHRINSVLETKEKEKSGEAAELREEDNVLTHKLCGCPLKRTAGLPQRCF